MIRLIVIRIFESAVRNFYYIIAPAIIIPTLVLGLQIVKRPEYLSGATVQIRYNYEISRVIGYEKFPASPEDPSERMFAELWELLQTDAFIDKVIERVDFTDERGVSQISSSKSEQREFVRDNLQIQITGIRQVAVLAYMPTPTSAQQIITAIYDTYLEHQITTIGGSGSDLVEFMNIYLAAKSEQRDKVQAELEAYLDAHPEDPSFDRREIEISQISQLTTILDDLTGDIDYTKDVVDLGSLIEGTSERYFRETFILLDDPFQAVSMTTLTKKLSNVLQGVAVGVVLSIIVLGVFVMFDQRITLPLDLNNATKLPLLTIVPKENASQRQRYNIKEKRKTFIKKLQNRFNNRPAAPIEPQPNRRGAGHTNRDLNTLRR